MTNTRDRVLKTLLSNQRCTINELAENVGINPISIRHHIDRLEAEGLVNSEDELHGVGRPRRVYFLTEAGIERFPTRYMRLTVRLLEQLKETMPAPIVNQLFQQMADQMVEDYAAEASTDGLSMEERLAMMQKTLARRFYGRMGDAGRPNPDPRDQLPLSTSQPDPPGSMLGRPTLDLGIAGGARRKG